MGHRSAFSLTFFRYTNCNMLKSNYITVTVHILAYSTHTHEIVLIGDHANWLFSCVLFMSFAAFSFGCTFCHPAEQAIDPETPLGSRSTRKITPNPTNCPHLNWPSWQLFMPAQGFCRAPRTWLFCPILVENPQALLLSVVRAQIAFSLLLYAVLKIFGRKPEMQKTEL